MLTQGEDVEAHALFKRGWSISAIARHLDRDRKTVRAYLNGDRQPGVRRSSAPDPLAPFVGLRAGPVRRRPAPVGDGVVRRGRAARLRALLSDASSASSASAGCARTARRARGVRAATRSRSIIRRVRRSSGTGSSGAGRRGAAPRTCCWARCRTRAAPVACWPSRWTRPHLIEAIDAVLRRLGGTARRVAHRPAGDGDRARAARDVQASFAPVAKHYGAIVVPCPPRRGNRKGAVECGGAIHVRPVVADDDRDHPGGGAGQPGPVLGHHRRRPAAHARAYADRDALTR